MEGRGQLLTGTAQKKYAGLGAEAVNRHFLDFHSQQPTSCVEKVRSQILSLRHTDSKIADLLKSKGFPD